jgi:hypothetical protein
MSPLEPEIDEDWWLLAELRAVHHAPQPPEPIDFEEDWDAIRPDPRWYLALYDADRQLIPGTVIRVASLSGVSVKFLAPATLSPVYIGWWSKAHPEVRYLKTTLSDFLPSRAWGFGSKQLVGTIHIWTMTNINVSTATTFNTATFTVANSTGTNMVPSTLRYTFA